MLSLKEGKPVKLTSTLKVKNRLGLHARPAAAIVKLLQPFSSNVFFTYKKETVNAKSILGILLLAVKKNSHIIVTVEGDDAKEVMDSLTDAFDNRFGEGL